jgi:hypothetical protein
MEFLSLYRVLKHYKDMNAAYICYKLYMYQVGGDIVACYLDAHELEEPCNLVPLNTQQQLIFGQLAVFLKDWIGDQRG